MFPEKGVGEQQNVSSMTFLLLATLSMSSLI